MKRWGEVLYVSIIGCEGGEIIPYAAVVKDGFLITKSVVKVGVSYPRP